jgi:peptide/nickel transport system permease protein
MRGDIRKNSTTYDDEQNGKMNTKPVPASPLEPAVSTTVITASGQIPRTPAKVQRPWGNLLQLFTTNTRMIIGFSIVGFFILLAVFGPLLLRQSPTTFTNDLFQHPSATHWFGTTQRGEDLFAQVVYGAHISLLISFAAAIGATLISVVVGLTAGYFGGWIDDALSFLANIFLVIPGMPLAIVIASFAVKGTLTIVLVLLFTNWSWGARVLRSQTLSMSQREFVTAARTVGESSWRIIFFEILPNEIAIVASSFVGTFIYAALAEVALEFLGLGDVSVPSWGVILYWAQADGALISGAWWQFIPPGLCVALLCSGLAFVNFGIDEVANPALRKERKKRKSRKAVA